jgi:hypothetical protein
VSFDVAAEIPPKRPLLEAIRSTLPKGWAADGTEDWDAKETLEGRVIYSYWDRNAVLKTTWKHPTLDESEVPQRESAPSDPIVFTPKYEALSYAWGSTTDAEIVYVDQEQTPPHDLTALHATLELGPNLATALRYLRYIDKSRKLWIDAICINQQDNPE